MNSIAEQERRSTAKDVENAAIIGNAQLLYFQEKGSFPRSKKILMESLNDNKTPQV